MNAALFRAAFILMRALSEKSAALSGSAVSICACFISENDAGDLLQETMPSAWQAYGHFDERSSFKTWLFTIARRRICNYYRKKEGSGESCLLDEAIAPDSQTDNSSEPCEDFTSDTVGRLDVDSAIASLNPNERELVEPVFNKYSKRHNGVKAARNIADKIK